MNHKLLETTIKNYYSCKKEIEFLKEKLTQLSGMCRDYLAEITSIMKKKNIGAIVIGDKVFILDCDDDLVCKENIVIGKPERIEIGEEDE
jgi:hypothetical protein